MKARRNSLVPQKITSSSAENITGAVQNTLMQWNVADRVAAMSFDITSSNTGKKTGVCLLSQQNIDRKLIDVVCRHHKYELVLRGVFELELSKTSAPKLPIFKRFAKSWKIMDQDLFKNDLKDDIICCKTSDE